MPTASASASAPAPAPAPAPASTSASASTPAPTPEELAKHVTIWNRIERRKIAGNAAPLRRNLPRYLIRHPQCEAYRGQDRDPALRAGAIDPVTGERIAAQNVHVPIWHRTERRKVTGNAAPLRKNLEAYLVKSTECEVYTGQDKVHKWAQPNSNPATANLNDAHIEPSNAAASSDHDPMSSGFHQHHHAHQPVRRWIYGPGKAPAWSPPQGPLGQGSSQIHGQASGSNQPSSIPVVEPSYVEMASSWSNNPEWVNQGAPQTSFTPSMMSGLQGLLPNSFSSNYGSMFPMDITDTNIDCVPIPGGFPRERQDVSMGTSYGTGFTPTEPSFFGDLPRSVDAEPDAMQFSPSHYFLGSLPARSPPLALLGHSFFKPAPMPGSQI